MKTPVGRRNFVAAVTSSLGALAQSAPAPGTTRPLPPDAGLFPGFEAKWVSSNGAGIFLRHGGEGPPLLLLYGNPQSLTCWHKVATRLAKRFHVVAADLRGYGDSIGPTDGGNDHIHYSFRVMAQDQVNIMAALGYDRFFVAGHDRGARTAHRMALDHPGRVLKAALLDILPTRHVWANTSKEWALNSWH